MGLSAAAVPYASYLRVYEPLTAFAEPERGHWTRYAASPRRPSAQDELRQALADLLPVPPVVVPVHESGEAFVAVVDETVYVCPWRTRLRGWMALEEVGEGWPGPVLDAVLPPVVRRQAAADYESWRERHPDARPWIRSATWQVPVRWFVLFDDAERLYEPAEVVAAGPADPAEPVAPCEPGAPGESPAAGSAEAADTSGEGDRKQATEPVMRYRTAMVQARRRVARALRVLRDSLGENALIEDLVDVGRWLEEFHPRSLVELDYGGLVHAIAPGGLAADRSAADVAEGLAALREGDSTAAGEAYRRLSERWRAVRDLQFAS